MGTAPRWVPLSQETRIEKLTHRQGDREKKQRRVRGREGRRECGGWRKGGRERGQLCAESREEGTEGQRERSGVVLGPFNHSTHLAEAHDDTSSC